MKNANTRRGNTQESDMDQGCFLRPLWEKVGEARMRGYFLFHLTTPSPALRAFPDYDLPGRRLPARGEANKRSGFTLIELLVVVLIIGILAAVALPQYQTAVRKAQFVQMRVVAENLAKGLNVYYAANGTWPDMLSQLDIGLPPNLDLGDLQLSTASSAARCKENSAMYCCISLPKSRSNLGSITCGDKSYSFAYVIFYASDDGSPLWTRYCEEKQGAQINFCNTLPHTRSVANGSGMATPAGFSKYDGVEL